MDITVRPLESTDAERVAVLIRQLTENIVRPDELVSRIKKFPEKENAYWFVVDHNLTAIAVGGLLVKELMAKGLVGTIQELVVDKAFRGQGVDKKVAEKLLEIAKSKGVSQVNLTAKPGAIELYESLGFVSCGDEAMILRWY